MTTARLHPPQLASLEASLVATFSSPPAASGALAPAAASVAVCAHRKGTPKMTRHHTVPAASRRHIPWIKHTLYIIGGHMPSRVIAMLSYATAAIFLAYALVAAVR